MKEKCENWTLKNTGREKKVPLKHLAPQTKPMELCTMGVLGSLPETISGNKYIVVL